MHDLQLEGIALDKMFTDKASGKDVDRPQLEAMLSFIGERSNRRRHAQSSIGSREGRPLFQNDVSEPVAPRPVIDRVQAPDVASLSYMAGRERTSIPRIGHSLSGCHVTCRD
jgi:hypothetical protein